MDGNRKSYAGLDEDMQPAKVKADSDKRKRAETIILISIQSKDELPEVETSIPSHGIRVSYPVWTCQSKAMRYDFHRGYWAEMKDINPRTYKTEAITWYKKVYLSDAMLDFSQQREVSDEEIEDWAKKMTEKEQDIFGMKSIMKGNLIQGAKAMRDGKIR